MALCLQHWFYLWKGSCKQRTSSCLQEWGRLDFLWGGSWAGGENFVERFVLPAVVWWDTSQAPHTYGSCCLSWSKNKTSGLLGFVHTGKCILRAKKVSRVFPASSLQKVACQWAAAHLQRPRRDRERHWGVAQSQVLLETTKSWRLCNICDARAD